MRIINKIFISLILFVGGFSSMAYAQDNNIPQPSSWSFPDIVESARKISPKNIEGHPFNQFGLAYPKGTVTMQQIKSMPTEQLQKYADIVTHAYPDAIAKQLPLSCKDISISQLNETSIAGFAYISINAIKSASRENAKNCLKDIKNKL